MADMKETEDYLYFLGAVPWSILSILGGLVILLDWSTERYKFNRAIWLTIAVSNILFVLAYHWFINHVQELDTSKLVKSAKVVSFTIRAYIVYLYAYLATLQHVWAPHIFVVGREDLSLFQPSRVLMNRLILFMWVVFLGALRQYSVIQRSKAISLLFDFLQVLLPALVMLVAVTRLVHRVFIKPPAYLCLAISDTHTVAASVKQAVVRRRRKSKSQISSAGHVDANAEQGRQPRNGDPSNPDRATTEEGGSKEQEAAEPDTGKDQSDQAKEHLPLELSASSDQAVKRTLVPGGLGESPFLSGLDVDLQRILVKSFYVERDMTLAVVCVCLMPILLYCVGYTVVHIREFLGYETKVMWAIFDVIQFFSMAIHLPILLLAMPAFRRTLRKKVQYVLKHHKCPPTNGKI